MTSSFASPSSPLTTFLLTAPREVTLAAAAARANPRAAALIAHFTAAAPTLRTADALLKDYQSLSVVLGAFGVANQIGNTALLRKILSEDPSQPGSTVSRLGNARLTALAQTLAPKASGSPARPPLSNPATISAIVKAYSAGRYETQIAAGNGDLRLALYFARNIGSISSLTQLQGDPDLLKVAVAAAGIDFTAFAQLDFSRQTALLKAKLKPANFTDASWVRKTAEQFLVAKQAAQLSQGQAAAPGSLASLFGAGATTGLPGFAAGSAGGSASGAGLLSILSASRNASSDDVAANPLLSLFV